MRLLLFVVLLVLFAGKVNAHVRLDNPVGGEVYFSGEVVTVTWSIQVAHTQLNWDLYFSADNGVTWEVVVEDLPIGRLQYNWTVPNLETTAGMIRIVQDNEGLDYDDIGGPFVILGELTGPLLTVNPMIIDFKSVEVNNNILVDLTLKNSGLEELIIDSFSEAIEPFEVISTMALPIAISPDESVDIQVKFSPMDEGEFGETVTITSNSQIGDVELFVEGEGGTLAKAEATVCYATTGINEGGSLLAIDLSNGSASKIADLDGFDLSPAIAINSMLDAFIIDPIENKLYRISCTSGKSSFILSLNVSDIAMDFTSNDVLYLVGLEEDGSRNLYSLHIDDDVVKTVGAVSIRFTGISIDPTSDMLYGITKEGELYTIDKETAATALLGSAGQTNMTDIAFDSKGDLFGVYGGGMSSSNKMISIDKVSGGKLADIGSTGFTAVAGLAVANAVPLAIVEDNLREIIAYPNPFSDRIQIEFPTHQNQMEVAIYTLTGQPIKVLHHRNGTNAMKIFWDGTDSDGYSVAPGIYLLVSRSMENIQTQTILFK